MPIEIGARLDAMGYAVITSVVPPTECPGLARAYDAAVLAALPDDVSIRSSIRVNDFVNRGPAFDHLYLYLPLLAASCQIIRRPFRLSTLLARTLPPNTPAQDLHVNFARDSDGWTMAGFILMIDEFRPANGATRFVSGSP